jgi:hypothetical protein
MGCGAKVNRRWFSEVAFEILSSMRRKKSE